MPIYEYRCNNCHRKVSFLIQGFSPPQDLKCKWCQSKNLTRIFSTFGIRKSTAERDKSIYEDILGDSRLTSAVEAGDPRALAEWNKKMSQGMNEELSPEHEEMVERLEHGESPYEVAERAKGQMGTGEED
jgi:putative FmdB family regulatory protein